MKAYLLLILLISIVCQPSYLLSREERLKRQREAKAKYIECLKERGSKDFIKFIEEHETHFRNAIYNYKDQISKEDKLVMRYCTEHLSH